MEPSLEQRLHRACNRLDIVLRGFQDEEERIVGSQPSPVRWIAHALSGAEFQRDGYHLIIDDAQKKLREARLALARGDAAQATRFLQGADQRLQQADTFWNQYLGATTKGAKRAAIGLGIVSAGALTFATAGLAAYAFGGASLAIGVGAAAGLHGAGGAWLYLSGADEPAVAPARSQVEALEGPDISPTPPDRPSTRGPRAKDEIIAEAQQRLRQWRECHSDPLKACGLPPETGSFLIEGETAASGDRIDADLSAATLERWEKDAVAASDAAKGEEGEQAVQAVMERLFAGYLPIYTKVNARLSDFLAGAGGNCEAQTKFILSAMAAAGVRLEPPQTFAVQVFRDHVQAVVYDRETGEIWNLLTGEKTKELRAPLYDPHVLYAAYLKGQKAKSPATDRELLIAAATKDESGVNYTGPTNTKLSFPRGASFAATGPIPDRSVISSPFQRPGPSAPEAPRPPRAISLEELPEAEQKAIKEKWPPDAPPFAILSESILFRTREQATHFRALKSKDAEFNFLIQLLSQFLAHRAVSTDFKRALEIASDPDAAKRYPHADLVKAANSANDVFNLAGAASYHMAASGYGTGFESIYGRIASQNIALGVLRKRLEELRRRFEGQPLNFVQLINELPSDKRLTFLYITTLNAGLYGRLLDQHLEAVLNAAADPRLVGIGKQAGRVQATYVKIDLALSDLAPAQEGLPKPALKGAVPGSAEEAGRKGRGKKSGDAVADESDAPVRISAECLIDFMLIFTNPGSHFKARGPHIYGRWNPRISREFMRLNKDGRYDDAFLKHYPSLVSYAAVHHPESLTARDDSVTCERPDDNFNHGEPCRLPEDIAQILADIRRRKGAERQLAMRDFLEEYISLERILDFEKQHGGRTNKALASFEITLASHTGNAFAQFNRGLILTRLQRGKEALRAYDRALELDPHYARTHYYRGCIFYHLGQDEDALQAFDRALKSDPAYATAYENRGFVLRQLGRYEEALQAFDRRLELDPKSAPTHVHRGAVVDTHGQARGTTGQASLDLNPGLADILRIARSFPRSLPQSKQNNLATTRYSPSNTPSPTT